MVKFTQVWTQKGFKFRASLLKPNVYILAEHSLEHSKSLTNNIEEVLEHIYWGLGNTKMSDYRFYQWCENEGLFQLDFNVTITSNLTGDDYHLEILNPKWTFISKDMKALEVLYG